MLQFMGSQRARHNLSDWTTTTTTMVNPPLLSSAKLSYLNEFSNLEKFSKASESSLPPLLHVLLTCLHKALLVVHLSVLPFEPKIDPLPGGLALLPSPVPFKARLRGDGAKTTICALDWSRVTCTAKDFTSVKRIPSSVQHSLISLKHTSLSSQVYINWNTFWWESMSKEGMEAIDWKDPDDFSRVGRREQADVQILVNSLHNQLFLKCVEWCIFQQCMSLTEVSRIVATVKIFQNSSSFICQVFKVYLTLPLWQD